MTPLWAPWDCHLKYSSMDDRHHIYLISEWSKLKINTLHWLKKETSRIKLTSNESKFCVIIKLHFASFDMSNSENVWKISHNSHIRKASLQNGYKDDHSRVVFEQKLFLIGCMQKAPPQNNYSYNHSITIHEYQQLGWLQWVNPVVDIHEVISW